MRIRVDYTTIYDYSAPATDVLQLLRVEPGSTDDQHVVNWRLDVGANGHLRRSIDVFGNVCHMFYADAPLTRLALHVVGDVDTSGGGRVNGSAEPLPPPVFLRTSPLTAPDAAIREFARRHVEGNPLDTCHAINRAINAGMIFDADATHPTTGAADSFGLGRGVCQDYSHIFCAAVRSLGIPARYVSGHLVRIDGLITQPAGHAWAEAHVGDFGWVGFDPTNGLSTTPAHLRVAVGIDYSDASPVRGSRRGGGAETMVVTVTTRDIHQQMQVQA